MADLTGLTIAQYKILRKIESGNMGVVYKAKDTRLGRLVAIKFLSPQLVIDQKSKERFVKEAKAASALDHHNICAVYEFNQTTDGQLYMVMPLYSGESLRSKLDRGALNFQEVVNISLQLCEALHLAHSREIVHRDLKPANIFITDEGIVKLLDFGIAKLAGGTGETSLHNLSGTIPYMSPEQILGETVDNRTDLWSLGIVIYEMISGQRPFSGEYTQTITYSILNDDPESILDHADNIPVAFDTLVRKLLAKQARNRYQLATDVATDLRKIIEPRAELTSEPNEQKPLTKIPRHLYAVGVLVVILISLLIFFWGKPDLGTSKEKQIVTVLPLENLSQDEFSSALYDGFTESMIAGLAGSHELSVRPWLFSKAYKDSTLTMEQLREKVGGDLFITGSVSQQQDSITLKLSLLNASDNALLWKEFYNITVHELMALQKRASRQILSILSPESTIESEDSNKFALRPESVISMYYLQAKGLYYRYTESDNENAIQLFKKVLQQDPDFAQAHAGLADAYIQKFLRFSADSTWIDSALQRSDRALQLDGNLAEAFKAKGLICYTRGWFEQAITFNQKALDNNPNHAPALANLGWSQLQTGSLVEALNNLNQAYRLYPTNPAILTGVGYIYLIFGQDDLAAQWLQYAYDLQPDYQPNPGLLLMMMQMLQSDSATSDFQDFSAGLDPLYMIQLADMFYERGDLSQAAVNYMQAMVADPHIWHPFTGINVSTSLGILLKQIGEPDYQSLFEISRLQNSVARKQGSEWWGIEYDLAAFALGQGNINAALQHLEMATDKGFRFSRYLRIDPHFTVLHTNDRFKALLKKIDALNSEYRSAVAVKNLGQ